MCYPQPTKRLLCHALILLLLLALMDTNAFGVESSPVLKRKPNVILIICDDLNDYVEGMGGHPQAKTPNINRLSKSGVMFSQAHCNIPICAPCRASLFTGIYPHNSGCYGFEVWRNYEVLKNSRTIMDHFRANGYQTVGTGKMMHHHHAKGWDEYEQQADYGPFPHNGNERTAHPDVPPPFRDIGPIDGSFGPLVNLQGRALPAYLSQNQNWSWQTGNWRGYRDLKVNSQADRDPTGDEVNANWAVKKLESLANDNQGKPFFMGVGFLRPHTPLIVPQKYFDQFPLDTIQLPVIKSGDADDTHALTVRPNPETDKGTYFYKALGETYGSNEDGLKRFIQAYLASVAAVDEQIGLILDALDNSPLKDNTIVILTSDHGWGMGQKDYVYKNSLWQESTRIPLIVRAPGISRSGQVSAQPVSLIDLFPTLIDLCELQGETKLNENGHELDGHSIKPLLTDPQTGSWNGPNSVLVALSKNGKRFDPLQQSYSLRSSQWRYIRYENGKEELYDVANDPLEWANLAMKTGHAATIDEFRSRLASRLPKPGAKIPSVAAEKKLDAAAWKDQFFKRHPEADTNKDGKLSWPEHKAYKAKLDAKEAGKD